MTVQSGVNDSVSLINRVPRVNDRVTIFNVLLPRPSRQVDLRVPCSGFRATDLKYSAGTVANTDASFKHN